MNENCRYFAESEGGLLDKLRKATVEISGEKESILQWVCGVFQAWFWLPCSQIALKYFQRRNLLESLVNFLSSCFGDRIDWETTQVCQRGAKVQDLSCSKQLVGHCVDSGPVHVSRIGICVCRGFVSQWQLYRSAKRGDRTGYNVPVSIKALVLHLSLQLLSLDAVSKALLKAVKLEFVFRLN